MLTTESFPWLDLMTVLIITTANDYKKTTTVFLIFQKICKKNQRKNYISGILTFESKLQMIHVDTYITISS